MKIEKTLWGSYQGKDVCLYTMKNDSTEIRITNLGCTIVSINYRGREILLGYQELEQLLADKYYMGCIVGRFAGRISNAAFSIDGKTFHLAANEGQTGNHLHGGYKGFNQKVFKVISQQCGNHFAVITFQAKSQHLDQGYPGNLDITFSISLNGNNEIMFSYFAVPDQPTHINLTHHLYYNLTNTANATNQHLKVNASSVVHTTNNYIPSGKIIDTPQDANFSQSRKIPSDLDYNECYVLQRTNSFSLAAELLDPDSGLLMQLSTTCPAVVFYSGQFLSAPFEKKQGICLETQYFPDTPNRKEFPSTLYYPGNNFKEYTKLNFKNID